MNYRKIAPGIFLPETNTPEPVFLEDLENKLETLNNQKKAGIPTDEELIEYAKIFHPAFNPSLDVEINKLIELISELKEL